MLPVTVRTMRRGIGTALATGAALFALAPSAHADHHLVSITEVFPGTTAQPEAEFVQLQMYAAGQNNFDPATELVLFDSAGGPHGSLDLPDVTSGASQRSLLAGTSASETTFFVSNDADYAGDFLVGAGGAVCLESLMHGTIDCVAWGTTTLPEAGASAAGIPDGSSLSRSLAPGCNTLLEAGDDTDSSAADFLITAFPSPVNNQTAPTESSCPNTEITKAPKTKTKDRTPTFEFAGAPRFQCDLDQGGFEECASPFAPGKLSKGKHTIAVRALEDDGSLDATPATYAWKIKKKKRKKKRQ